MVPPLVFSGGQVGIKDGERLAGSVGMVIGLEGNGVAAGKDQTDRLESLLRVDQVVAGVRIDLKAVFMYAGLEPIGIIVIGVI